MPVLQAVLTCPLCRHRAVEVMPEDACQSRYRCGGCGETLKPRAGDCCVFCSYADARCPPMQES
ncbi:MAG: GDCCVxC domain-containing (seleno)protein [Jatrophihabitantaceae bacterium]